MKTVYFVRHASTEGNEKGAWQFATTPLSAKGLIQAKYVAQRFASIDIDTIIASEMQRALQTAREIADVKGIEIIPSPLFHEILRPSEMRGKSRSDSDAIALWQKVDTRFREGIDEKHSDEENFFDCRLRAALAVKFIEDHSSQNMCIVTHGAFLRILIAVMMGGSDVTVKEVVDIFDFFHTSNTGITKCTLEEKGWWLRSWNDDAHLGEITAQK